MAESVSVLVVEDEADTRDSLATLLTLSGHSVRVAPDAAGGLELAAAAEPDVVLLDLGLPRINGYDFARQLRRMNWKHRPVLIAVTGFGNQDARERASEAGIDLHLLKPFSPSALISLLNHFEQLRSYVLAPVNDGVRTTFASATALANRLNGDPAYELHAPVIVPFPQGATTMKKKFTPDPDQKPGGKLSDAGMASTEATRPETSGFEDQRDFDQEDTGRDAGGATGIHHSRDKGPTKPSKSDAG